MFVGVIAVFGGDTKRLKLMGGDYVRRSIRRVKVRGKREEEVHGQLGHDAQGLQG